MESGSLVLAAGALLLVGLALLLALAFLTEDGVATPAGALLFVGVPIADTTIAIVRRRRAGRPLLQGDRGHVYDQLVDMGWSVPRATLSCIAAQAALVVLGLAASTQADVPGAALVASVVVVVGSAALATFTAPSERTTRTT